MKIIPIPFLNLHKRIFLCLASVMLFSLLPLTARTLRVGFFIAEPQCMINGKGEPEGVSIDYFREIADRLGLADVEFVPYPFMRLLTALELGEIDAVLFLSHTPEREQKFSYPSLSLFSTYPCLVVNESGPLKKVEEPEDLEGIRIVYTAGGSLSPFLQAAELDLHLLYHLNSGESQVKMLRSNRVDAVYSPDQRVISYYVRQ